MAVVALMFHLWFKLLSALCVVVDLCIKMVFFSTDPAKLDSRYNSDPNLASQDKKSINGIPDYNAPPPNSAINPVTHTPKVNTNDIPLESPDIGLS